MPITYEIYADEAWTHGGQPLNRYWCFFGGIFGPESSLDQLNTELAKIKAAHSIKAEIKWSDVRANNVACCTEMVDCLIRHLRSNNIRYRQMFLDRALVRIARPGEAGVSELTAQFKLFYQFLKHAFGLRYLPPAPAGDSYRILIRLDNHSSLKHKNDLAGFVQHLPAFWGRSDMKIEVTFLNSTKNNRLQICDVMMGAAGSHGNKAHKRRRPGQRGMTEKQKIKHGLAMHIYNQLRQLDADERGSHAFNWFETTGLQGDICNTYLMKARMWKFKPERYQVDRGWQNDHLDSQGLYQGPDIVSVITVETEEETY